MKQAPRAQESQPTLGPVPEPRGRARGWRSLPVGVRERERGAPERRGSERKLLRCPVRTSTIDPVLDSRTGESSFLLCDEDHTLDLSRRGLCLLCERPPEIGTRLLLQLSVDPDQPPVDLVGRACWTRVEFVPGLEGGRPRCRVGVEIMGGAADALDRLERAWVAR